MTHIDRYERFPRVRPHRLVVCALALFILSAGLAVAQERDPKAVEITEAMLEKMGGFRASGRAEADAAHRAWGIAKGEGSC